MKYSVFFTEEEFQNFQPENNWVLIKPQLGNQEIKINQGEKTEFSIHLDITFHREKHAPVTGEVIRTPKKLKYGKKVPESMDWKTNMELKEGDQVVYHYLAAINALGPLVGEQASEGTDFRNIIYNGEIYFLIKYDQIFVARRNEEGQEKVVMLNGYVLASPMKRKLKKTKFSLPDNLRNQNSLVFAKIEYTGTPNKQYLKNDGSLPPDGDDVYPGDFIVMEKVSDLPLEYGDHKSFEGDKEFFRMQRYQVLGKIPEEAIEEEV